MVAKGICLCVATGMNANCFKHLNCQQFWTKVFGVRGQARVNYKEAYYIYKYINITYEY